MVQSKFFERINSWNDYIKAQKSLNNKEKGNTFELLTKLYFQISPHYSFYENVWLLEDVPEKILNDIGLPRQDLGIDLIAKTENEYHAIQCKYHSDKHQAVTFREVSTFLSAIAKCDKITMGYICSTANVTSKNYDKVPKKLISKILSNTWENLSEEFFNNVKSSLKRKPIRLKVYKPRPHQKKAISNAIDHFKSNDRGKLIFPCGSGKSLTGFWITRELNSKNILIAVPSLSLIKQTLDVYLGQIVARKEKVKWLCICSDDGIGKSDDVALLTEDIGIPCVTDPNYISSWLKKNKNDQKIIFTTYQSGKLIGEISKKQKLKFDLGIFDEAHKTVGSGLSLFSYLLFEKNINIGKRVFMTATERFYSGSKDDIVSMDDPDIYGEVFCKMTFKDAIEKKLLTDYKIITLDIKESEISDFVMKNGLIALNKKWKNKTDARSLASMIALRKLMEKYPINNAVSFHSSIEKAKRNSDIHTYITKNYKFSPITTYTVSGKQPTSLRNDIVSDFANTKKALITNSRCLTEGVDVPNIDCIVFADPKKSKIDIVQALGRALRKRDEKEWGYVVLPIIYDDNHEIDNESFNDIVSIIRGLAANDERIIEYFKTKTLSSSGGNKVEVSDSVFEMISEFDLTENLEIKIWDNLSKLKIRDFDKARDFARELGLKGSKEWIAEYQNNKIPKDIPMYPDGKKYSDRWISWYDWLGNEENDPKNIAKRGLKEIKTYVNKNGHSYVKEKYVLDDGFKLGVLCKMIRVNNSYKEIHEDLSKIEGWAFDIEEDKFNKCFEELKKYQTNDGLISINKSKVLYIGNYKINLGNWFYRVKKNYFEVNKEDFVESKYKGLFDNNKDPRIKKFETLKGWSWSNKPIYPSFTEARKYSRSLKKTSWKEYIKEIRINNPINLPKTPWNSYKKEWTDIPDYIGSEHINTIKRSKWLENNMFNYDEAKEFLKNECSGEIKTMKEFVKWRKGLIKNKNLPKFPDRMPTAIPKVYEKSNDWINEYDFFGTKPYFIENTYGFKSFKKIGYNELKKIVHSKNFKTRKACVDWLKENKTFFNKRGLYAPVKGADSYKESKGWNEFLGKRKSPK